MPIDRQRNQKLCRQLSRMLGQLAKTPAAKTVHGFRTTSRRVETMLEALVPEPDRNLKKLLKSLARLRRRAGRVRNIDVQSELLRGLKIGGDGDRKKRVLQELAELRARREKKLAAALDGGALRQIRKRLLRATECTAHGPAEAFDPGKAALQEFTRFAREQATLNQDTLHAYRLQTKHARYVAELAENDERARRVVSELKRMQDAIGEWHDWAQLTARAEGLLANGNEVPLISALKNVTRAKYRQALSVCAETRKDLLDLAGQSLPARKESGSVAGPPRAATA
jgi:CHAD domain-containing protein